MYNIDRLHCCQYHSPHNNPVVRHNVPNVDYDRPADLLAPIVCHPVAVVVAVDLPDLAAVVVLPPGRQSNQLS